MLPTLLILNPRSGGGATGRLQERLRELAAQHLGEHEVWLTEARGHAAELATRARDQGWARVLAVGGDGTASEVVHGLMQGAGPGEVVFGLVPGGTGGDLTRSLGIPRRADQALVVLDAMEVRRIDLLAVDFEAADPGQQRRYCINVAGFGLNGEVVKRVNEGSKAMGGTLSFLTATLGGIAAYRTCEVEVRWVDAEGQVGAWSGKLMAAFVANGRYCGGGMWVGRGGSLEDGLADLTLIPDLGPARTLVSVPRLFTGTVDQVMGVLRTTVRQLEARPIQGSTVRVDVDGEQPGILPIRVTLLPKKLKVAGKWGDDGEERAWPRALLES